MIVSLRFNGLEVVAGRSLLPSPPNLESAWLIGAEISGLKCILEDRSKLLRSKLLRSAESDFLMFSCPAADAPNRRGVALPLSKVWLSPRFRGLLGEVRVRETGRAGDGLERADDRRANFALGGNGTARGEGVCDGLLPKMDGVENARFGGEGERGDLGDGLGDLVTRRNFEGDRESERLMDLTAEEISACVGEGRVRVPPLLEYDILVLRCDSSICLSITMEDSCSYSSEVCNRRCLSVREIQDVEAYVP